MCRGHCGQLATGGKTSTPRPQDNDSPRASSPTSSERESKTTRRESIRQGRFDTPELKGQTFYYHGRCVVKAISERYIRPCKADRRRTLRALAGCNCNIIAPSKIESRERSSIQLRPRTLRNVESRQPTIVRRVCLESVLYISLPLYFYIKYYKNPRSHRCNLSRPGPSIARVRQGRDITGVRSGIEE